jgi:hypothetical protein
VSRPSASGSGEAPRGEVNAPLQHGFPSLPQKGAFRHRACEGPERDVRSRMSGVRRLGAHTAALCVICPNGWIRTGDFPPGQAVDDANAARDGAPGAVSWRLREKPDRHAVCSGVLRQDVARGSVSVVARAPMADRAPRASQRSRSESVRGPNHRGRDRAAGRAPRRTGSPQPTPSRARLGPVHKGCGRSLHRFGRSMRSMS